MALITCPECGGSFSDTAHACPKCGWAYARFAAERAQVVAHHAGQKQVNTSTKLMLVGFLLPIAGCGAGMGLGTWIPLAIGAALGLGVLVTAAIIGQIGRAKQGRVL